MKGIITVLWVSLFAISASTQGVFDNNTHNALQKVIADFPNEFRNIRGDKLPGKSSEFQSTVQVPGSQHCVVVESRSRKNSTWECEFLSSSDFDRANKRFKEIYESVRNSIIKIDGKPPFILNGKFEYPNPDRDQTPINFELLPSSGEMQNLRVELLLRKDGNAWKVSLLVYDQDRKLASN
jgi:hypothetical protein